MYLDTVYQHKRRKVSKEGIAGFSLAFIPVLGYCLFSLIPMILAIAMAFMHIVGYSFEGSYFVGFDNFKDVLSDSLFWKSIVNTLYMSVSTFINILLALVVAFLLTKNIKGKKVFRTIYFIPYVCSVVAITLMWQWIFNYNYGILNNLIASGGGERINWLGDARLFIPAIIIISVWSGTGYGIILYSAALTNVSTSLYEAAKVDGASSFKSFIHITLPAISPTTFYLLITGLIGALQEFARPQILSSSGGPDNAGVTVVFYLYRRAFSYYEMGPASATAWLLAIFILVLTVINFGVSKLWVNYDN
jgi:multiple sugar transport system permease protein